MSTCSISLCLGQTRCTNQNVYIGNQSDRYFIQITMEGIVPDPAGTNTVVVSVGANGGSEGNCQGLSLVFDDFMLLNSNSDLNE
jgi:hypothetical protein